MKILSIDKIGNKCLNSSLKIHLMLDHYEDSEADDSELLSNAIKAAQSGDISLLQDLANKKRLFIKRSNGTETPVEYISIVLYNPNQLAFRMNGDTELKPIEKAQLNEYLSLR